MKANGFSAKDRNLGSIANSLRRGADRKVRSGPHASFLAVQGVVGNRAFGEFLASSMSLAAPSSARVGRSGEGSKQGSAETIPSVSPPGRATLQRKCACGGSPGPSGECEECRRKRLQREAVNTLEWNEEVPPIVHEVLGRAGRPLDAATRNFFEPRFGHDLSHIRVHTDAKAAESAQAVQAHAYW